MRDTRELEGNLARPPEHEAERGVGRAEAFLHPLGRHGERGHVEKGEEGGQDKAEQRVETRTILGGETREGAARFWLVAPGGRRIWGCESRIRGKPSQSLGGAAE